MKLAVISDSHHSLEDFHKVLKLLREEGITHLAHAGDFVTRDVELLFEAYPDITFLVAVGNCDVYSDLRYQLSRLPNVDIDGVISFELEGIRFGMSHIKGEAERELSGETIDVFIHGHTHQPLIEKRVDYVEINPGSLMDGAGFMEIDLPELKINRRFRLG